MSTLPVVWRDAHLGQQRGPSLKLTREAHEYLDELKREDQLGMTFAASNIILWVKELDCPSALDLCARRLTDSHRRRSAAIDVIEAIRRKYLGGN